MGKVSSSANPFGAWSLQGRRSVSIPVPGPCDICAEPAEWAFRDFGQRKAPPGQGTFVRACGRHWRIVSEAKGWTADRAWRAQYQGVR